MIVRFDHSAHSQPETCLEAGTPSALHGVFVTSRPSSLSCASILRAKRLVRHPWQRLTARIIPAIVILTLTCTGRASPKRLSRPLLESVGVAFVS
jgi:hypothetical protein